MGEHHHGSQDVSENQKVFEGFVRVAVYVAVGVAVILVFLAIVGT
jgi:hypothetical protein